MPSVAHVAGKTDLPYNICIYIYTNIVLQEKSCKFSIYILSHAYFDISVPCCLTLTLRHCPYRQGGPAPSTDGPQEHVSCLPFLAAFFGTRFLQFFYYSRIFFSQQINPWK